MYSASEFRLFLSEELPFMGFGKIWGVNGYDLKGPNKRKKSWKNKTLSYIKEANK